MPGKVSSSLYRGGWGECELSALLSHLDLTDGPVDGGVLGISTPGLNWWLTPTLMVNLNFRHIELDRFGLIGNCNALTGRVVLALEWTSLARMAASRVVNGRSPKSLE
jgi:hypothetical protein